MQYSSYILHLYVAYTRLVKIQSIAKADLSENFGEINGQKLLFELCYSNCYQVQK